MILRGQAPREYPFPYYYAIASMATEYGKKFLAKFRAYSLSDLHQIWYVASRGSVDQKLLVVCFGPPVHLLIRNLVFSRMQYFKNAMAYYYKILDGLSWPYS